MSHKSVNDSDGTLMPEATWMSNDICQGDWLHMTGSFPTIEEVIKGYDAFWEKNQVKEFPKDKDGKYIRDENGEIVVIRTDIPRVRKKSEMYFKNQRVRKEKTNEDSTDS